MTDHYDPYASIGRTPAIYAVLAMDGLYFNAAREALSKLDASSAGIDDLIFDRAALESRQEEIEAEQAAEADVREMSRSPML